MALIESCFREGGAEEVVSPVVGAARGFRRPEGRRPTPRRRAFEGPRGPRRPRCLGPGASLLRVRRASFTPVWAAPSPLPRPAGAFLPLTSHAPRAARQGNNLRRFRPGALLES